uniref:Uncharacterized protein n=1 Tax=Nelumbo nucifera TaxID=4432 RepID=A0A822XY43_NELNU|nr:TPA_asm: hypothetical protein HUJ06_023771 [Nelumbo nucifera]
MTEITNEGACGGNTSTTELFLRGTRAVPAHCLYVKKNQPLVLVIPIGRRRREEGRQKSCSFIRCFQHTCALEPTLESLRRGAEEKRALEGRVKLYDANPDILKALEGPASKY